MLRSLRRTAARLPLASWRGVDRWRPLSTISTNPLRILFCGSDEFSITALHALHNEWKNPSGPNPLPPAAIESIEVVCRPGKKAGRGMKMIREVPINAAAKKLGLQIHHIDTFNQWAPPNPFNLVVAVSFGLKIPPRILSLAEYAGLNVHPSNLPDLRGAAPIHHALLHGDTVTGVSVQTLHPTKIDHGDVLLQKRDIPIPNPNKCTAKELTDYLAPIGGKLLVQALREQVYLRANQKPPVTKEGPADEMLRRAPSFTKEDRRIDWKAWSASKILTRNRVLGDLWDKCTWVACAHAKPDWTVKTKRVLFHELQPLQSSKRDWHGDAGVPFLIDSKLAILAADGPEGDSRTALEVVSCTVEAEEKGKGVKELISLLKRKKEQQKKQATEN